MQRIELQVSNFKAAINSGSDLVSETVGDLLSNIPKNSKVAELRGIGFVSEHIGNSMSEVDLYEENSTARKTRNVVVPESPVTCISTDPSRLNFNNAPYDWVVIHRTSDMEYAESLASKGIINLETNSVTEVKGNNEKPARKSRKRTKPVDDMPESESEVVEDSAPVEEQPTPEDKPVHSDTDETPVQTDGTGEVGDSSSKPVEPVE